MAVIFEAKIKEDGIGGWFIELKDTTDNRVETCVNLEEFEKKIEELGDDYGGHIDEVKWSSDENIHPKHIDEVRMLMAEYQKKLDEEKGK